MDHRSKYTVIAEPIKKSNQTNQTSTEKRDQTAQQTMEETPCKLVEVKKEKNTQDSHLKENAAKNAKKCDQWPLLNLNLYQVQMQTLIKWISRNLLSSSQEIH